LRRGATSIPTSIKKTKLIITITRMTIFYDK
jgi:hypothetical protein